MGAWRMASFNVARERFTQAIAALEQALAAAGKRQDQHQETARELLALRARHAALQADHAALQKSYDGLRQQRASAARRLDGTIASLHEVLGA